MTTLNLAVGSSGADTYKGGASFSGTATALNVGKHNSAVYASTMLFTGATVTQGATVNSAVLTFTASTTRSNTTVNTNIAFEDADAATAPTSVAEIDALIAGQTTPVAFDAVGTWTAESEYTSPALASSLQEVIDRAGFTSSSVQAIFADDGSTAASLVLRSWYSYDGDSAKATKLDIDYTAGAAPSGNPAYYYAQL